MAALWLHLRAELRRRWPAWLAVVLLIGVVGGLVLGSVAGARRTATAFPRMLEATDAAHVNINPDLGAESVLSVDDVAALPGVSAVSALDGVAAVLLGADGEPDFIPMTLAQRDAAALVDFDRPRVLEGELFDPADPTHVMITHDVAERNGIGAGDAVTVGTTTLDDLEAWEEAGAEGFPPVTPREALVTAVVVTADGVVKDEVFAFGMVILSHAFAERHDLTPFYYSMLVHLDGGTDSVPALREEVRALVPDEVIEFRTLSALAETVERGARPHVLALLAFAAVMGLAGLVVCGQAVTRQLLLLVDDASSLRALGVTRRGLRFAATGRAIIVAGSGAVLSVAVAVGISPIFPLGVARRAELSAGPQIDLVVLAPGVVVLVLALVTWSAVATRRLRSGTAGRTRSLTPGVLERVARASGSAVVSTGVRSATASTGRRGAAPAAATVAGLAAAIGAVVAAMTFGASLNHLVTSPAAYGWSWDALVAPPGDFVTDDVVFDRIESSSAFAGSSVLTVDQLRIDGQRVPAVGMPTSGDGPGLTIIDGRAPTGPDELALGGRTMDLLGAGLGDRVLAGEGADARELEVVGQAVFPGLGTYSSADRTELGKGALLDSETLASVGEGFDFVWVAIDGSDAARLATGLADVTEGFESAVREGSLQVIEQPQRPSDVHNLEAVRGTPMVIAGVLALLAGTALAFVLVAGVRGRRRELALLKTFGFRRRDIAGTVAWQATVTAVTALAVGVPVGMVVGRLTWSALADSLGVARDPRVPLMLLVVPFAVVVLANLVAVVPGWIAARTKPSLSLRAE